MASFHGFLLLIVPFLFYTSVAQYMEPIENSKVLSKWSTYCPSGTFCRPLSSCPILQDIINGNCTDIDKVTGCGDKSGLFCCPLYQSENHGVTVDGVNCGRSSLDVNDEYKGIGMFPFVAKIGFKNKETGEIKFHCAGSILNSKFILTSAKCALTTVKNFNLYIVRVGEYATNTEVDCGDIFCGLPVQDILVDQFTVHPEYRWGRPHNNIGLIKLFSRIKFTATVQPICLPNLLFNLMHYHEGILVGWGQRTGQLGETYEQQALTLPIVSSDTCGVVFGNVTENEFCTANTQTSVFCGGYEGSPLLVKKGLNYFQIGVLSQEHDQCESSGASLYMNVIKYIDAVREFLRTEKSKGTLIENCSTKKHLYLDQIGYDYY